MRKRPIFLWVAGQDLVVSRLSRNLSTHRMLFAPGIENYRWVVGRWRAWRTFEMARRRVPAYRECVESVAPAAGVRLDGWLPDLTGIPEMDKASYIKGYGIEQRCLEGVLPRRGVVADESSGSSGSPTNWFAAGTSATQCGRSSRRPSRGLSATSRSSC
jgi:phenylacetate-CoA ligase